MNKLFAATALVLASGSALATTNIDVAFMVTQKTLDTYGYETVYNRLADEIATANTYYNKGIPGLDVSFNLKVVQPYDGVQSETTTGCAYNGKYNAFLAAKTLINNGHYTKDSSYIDVGEIDSCYTSADQAAILAAGTNSGADFVVMVDSITDDSSSAVADPQVAVTAHYPEMQSWVIAHEFGHLLGLADLYDEVGYDCNTTEAGRLMCAASTNPNVDSTTAAAALFNDKERSVVKGMLNVTDRRPSDISITWIGDLIGSGAGLATAIDAGDRTVTLAADNTTLTESSPKATFTVTMSAASDKPVLVTVYSKGVTATAGTEYLDNVAQTLTLEAGETSKTFTLTANKLDSFSGTKTVTVGVRSAAGATPVDNTVQTVTLTGTAKSSGGSSSGSSSSGSSGGGATDFGVLAMLAFASAVSRRFRK